MPFPVTRLTAFVCCSLFSGLLFLSSAAAEDWPTWRKDARRTATTDEQLAKDLHLQWRRQLKPPTTVAVFREWPGPIRAAGFGQECLLLSRRWLFLLSEYSRRKTELEIPGGPERAESARE